MSPEPQRPDIARDLLAGVQAAERNWHLPVAERAKATAAEISTMRHLDRANAHVLRRIVLTHGWPGRSLVGEEAARAAWLIALHADDDPAFQLSALRLINEAVRHGEATLQQWAHLYDRCCVHQGRPQLYGTQHRYGPAGLVPHPIAEPHNLDARRASVGLPPYAERAERIRRHHTGHPTTDPPGPAEPLTGRCSA
ncbi:DUF6624 domain-containing protein [Streptomyces sp. NPDC052236]|uniref:DUF6624 domain-containing protein n=1 Tax=Streptomyces sp. NPDC052236 TaxID=3365686 RepID=UPI0037D64D50